MIVRVAIVLLLGLLLGCDAKPGLKSDREIRKSLAGLWSFANTNDPDDQLFGDVFFETNGLATWRGRFANKSETVRFMEWGGWRVANGKLYTWLTNSTIRSALGAPGTNQTIKSIGPTELLFYDNSIRYVRKSRGIIELRIVEERAAADTEEMVLANDVMGQDHRDHEVLHVHKHPVIDQATIRSVDTIFPQQSGVPGTNVWVHLTDAGRDCLAEITRNSIGKRLAIIVDGKLVTAPRITKEMSGGGVIIWGRFSGEEAKALADRINAAVEGVLP